MKKILLIGDSIRMGYDQYVKEYGKDSYEVYFPEDNSRFVQYLYWQLNQMFRTYSDIDIVVFNSGYWDMNIETPMTEALNPVPDYIYYLQKVITLIKNQNCTPLFVNTCPIYINGHAFDNTGTTGSFNYNNDWVIQYNHAAESLMKENDVQIIDVYSSLLKGDHFYKCSDNLHLTEEGYQLCAKLIHQHILSI